MIFLPLITRNYVVSVRRAFLFLVVLKIGYVLWRMSLCARCMIFSTFDYSQLCGFCLEGFPLPRGAKDRLRAVEDVLKRPMLLTILRREAGLILFFSILE